MMNPTPQSAPSPRRPIALILLAWLILQLGGIFSPGLLDDVDSVYIEVAREMLHRHDYVTPYIDGIRFFDKPPLMYWLAAASMRLFGEHDWAARLPLTLSILALFLAIYALARRWAGSGNGALYAALAFATAIGPYLYTRFFIPDLLICLWMTVGVHLFLITLDRAASNRSALWPSIGFGATLALNLLTKGLIGLVFPLGFVLAYLFFTRQFRLIPRLKLPASIATFLAVALPWHILAALRNPAIPMPPGVGLPAKAGWAWFYLYNEHFARFLHKRIPQDYGVTPIWLFWLYTLIWIMPWAAFLPGALAMIYRHLGHRFPVTIRDREAALTTTLWAGIVLVFFTISNRQEYYQLPALPALALILGLFLARADRTATAEPGTTTNPGAPGPGSPASDLARWGGGPGSPASDLARWGGDLASETWVPTSPRLALACHRWLLLPLATLVTLITTWFAITAPKTAPGTDLSTLLSQNPDLYNLSLGHLFDLTGAAMGLFRGPLFLVAAGMLAVGPASYLLRRRTQTYAANLTLAAGMTAVLLAMHAGLVRFNPILGSKPLADAILQEQGTTPEKNDRILLDGELTSGSTLLFYTRQPIYLVNGRINGPWFGSFWPDSPSIFEDEATLRTLWSSPTRVFLLTYHPIQRQKDLSTIAPVRTLATAGGKTILTNH